MIAVGTVASARRAHAVSEQGTAAPSAGVGTAEGPSDAQPSSDPTDTGLDEGAAGAIPPPTGNGDKSASSSTEAAPSGKKEKKNVTGQLVIGVLMGIIALGLALYVPFSQWWNDREHAKALAELNAAVQAGPEERIAKIREDARAYNTAFLASGDNSGYAQQLDPFGDGVMGRIKIDKINVDLPIYHYSTDDVLRKGAGHMEETTLPVGGKATHAAITAHRGLAESRLFTDLDQVDVGDSFTIEVLGDALVYEVVTKRIVEPTETQWLVTDRDRDLVTLITCDPLGVNTERMLVTGERIFPTPQAAIDDVGKDSELPGFPWWLVAAAGGFALIMTLAWLTARPKKPRGAVEREAGSEPEPGLDSGPLAEDGAGG